MNTEYYHAKAEQLATANATIVSLRREVAECLPWKLYYQDNKTLGEIAAICGGTIYDYSPALYAPMLRHHFYAKAEREEIARLTQENLNLWALERSHAAYLHRIAHGDRETHDGRTALPDWPTVASLQALAKEALNHEIPDGNQVVDRLAQDKAELVAALERCVNDWIWLVQNPGAPIAGTARMDHGVIEAQSLIAKAKGDQ